jgi:tetratricopeptide (TPR) repeat protein
MGNYRLVMLDLEALINIMRNLNISKMLLIFTAIIIALSGCAPKGDPKEAVDSYYQYIVDGNYEMAYEQLSETNKKAYGKDNFVLYQRLLNEVNSLKGFTTAKISESKKESINGIEYRNVIEFTVSAKIYDYYNDKEITDGYSVKVINDNQNWRVLREPEVDINTEISSVYVDIGYMYFNGKGNKTVDYNQAANYFNKALERNPDNALAYYALSGAYLDLNRFDDSIEKGRLCIEKSNNDEQKSDAYNVIGLAYANKGQIEDAKEAFRKALELNPNNEYAKTNLAKAEQL